MPKLGQAEFAEFLVELFMESKLSKMLETEEKQNFSSKNTEDIYKEFPSAKDAAQEDKMLGFIIGLMVGGTTGVFTMCLCRVASDADKCMDSTYSDE